jgi:hypothetical protein
VRLLGILALCCAASTAEAAVRRFAVIAGANHGDAGEVELRFAESDAERLGRVLREVGGFAPEDIALLTGSDAGELRRALLDVNIRIRQAGDTAMLFVFYSGHADSEALHLGGSRFAVQELKGLVQSSPARARVLVVDACRSGAVTRMKGGVPGPTFAIDLDEASLAEGLAIMTSSAAGEDAQESDQLGASFFTHFLVSALIGAADRDSDGAVTLGEAFGYASERTLLATASTVAGPQHPTYRYDLGGTADLVLSQPGRAEERLGVLALAEAGVFVIQQGGPEGPVIAEVAAENGGRRVALAPGRYFVTRRAPDHLLQGAVALQRGRVTPLERDAMHRVEFARLVRKGGRDASLSAYVVGGMRGPVAGVGAAYRSDLGVRLDLPSLALELRLGGTQPFNRSRPLHSPRELVLGVVGLHAFDLGPAAVGVGVELGYDWILYNLPDDVEARLTDEQRAKLEQRSWAFLYGPALQVDTTLWGGVYLRFEAAGLAYSRPVTTESGQTALTSLITYRLGLALGVYF